LAALFLIELSGQVSGIKNFQTKPKQKPFNGKVENKFNFIIKEDLF